MDKLTELIQDLELVKLHFGEAENQYLADEIIDRAIKQIKTLKIYKDTDIDMGRYAAYKNLGVAKERYGIRELCRAKRLDTGKWVQGFIIRDEQDMDKCFIGYVDGTNPDNTPHDFDITAVDPSTICHCLGMTDKNKQLVFEKDIVEFVSSPILSDKYLLWWNNEMSCMTAVDMDEIHFNGLDYDDGNPSFSYDAFCHRICFMMQDPYGEFRDIKVAGNLIDNPELVKEMEEETEYERD